MPATKHSTQTSGANAQKTLSEYRSDSSRTHRPLFVLSPVLVETFGSGLPWELVYRACAGRHHGEDSDRGGDGSTGRHPEPRRLRPECHDILTHVKSGRIFPEGGTLSGKAGQGWCGQSEGPVVGSAKQWWRAENWAGCEAAML